MLIFPTYQNLLTKSTATTSTTSYDTVTLASGSPFTEINQITSAGEGLGVDDSFSFNFANVPTVAKAGKRVSIIHFIFRMAGNNTIANWTNYFKPSNQSGSAAFTLGGSTPTLVDSFYSQYNGVASYYLIDDLNTSGSNASVTFSWNNTSFTDSGSGSRWGTGGYAVVLWVIDYIQTINITPLGYNGTDNTVNSINFDGSYGGTGSGWTAALKAITGVASNPPANVNPLWTKDSADTSTYTVALEGDNGSDEVSETSYSFESTGTPSNIKGSMGLDSGSATAGLGALSSFVRFKPSESS